MLRTVNAQPTLWEAILPEMCLGMPAELEAVDRLLDDRGLLQAVPGALPLRPRPSLGADRDLPAAHVLEVPLPPRLRAALPRGGRLDLLAAILPDPPRGGCPASDDADEDHDPLRIDRRGRPERGALGQGRCCQGAEDQPGAGRHDRGPANVAYPTDSGLLAKGVAKMAKAVERLKAGGLAPRIATRDRTRLVRRHARSIGANLRRRTEEAKDEVMAINARMARIASEAVGEARASGASTPGGCCASSATLHRPDSSSSPTTLR